MILDAPSAAPRVLKLQRPSMLAPPPAPENLLLTELADGDRTALEPCLRPTGLTQGRVLFEPGEEITHFYFPRSGAVSMVLVMGDGALVETLMVGREGAIDPACLAGPRAWR